MKNREVFLTDPTTFAIPNEGVAKIYNPHSTKEWQVLRWELSSFVCEGEYRKGLERILSTYLSNRDKPEQPAVWVSGFYGSGKSHFVRVLEYLWRDVQLPDGASARSLVKVPPEISDLLKELSTVGKQEGGLWSAAGTMGASAGDSVRLAVLATAFQSAGLSEKFPIAKFSIWLKQNGFYDKVKADVEGKGKDFTKELNNFYVSPYIIQSLVSVYPDFAQSSADGLKSLREQYPNVSDISDEDLLTTFEEVLQLQSNRPGKLPCALLILDEMQQFIGDDSERALKVQNLVQTCCARLGSRMMFVATGQAALPSFPQLSKLQDRFTVPVTLSDTDVDNVVREVVLRKKPDKMQSLKSVLDKAQGEIDRHLAGTKIGPNTADAQDLIADYPLLPVRRRFWERILRTVDIAGKAGQLRTQLRIIHEAARFSADCPLGTVIPADLIYDQQKTSMMQNGVLLRDIALAIEQLNDGSEEGKLSSRLCALSFLIGKLPTEGISATGVRATANVLADLLVEDLVSDSAALRAKIPVILQKLADSGNLMLVGNEYRVQSRESAEWEADYRKRYAAIHSDDTRVASDRATEIRNAFNTALKGMTLVQGQSKTPRKYELCFGGATPKLDGNAIPIWIRDEWEISEKSVLVDAQTAGIESPTVFIFVPKASADTLREALASQAAAIECISARPTPNTPEGLEAYQSMQSRVMGAKAKVDSIIAIIISGARVLQGGGTEVVEGNLASSVKAAAEAALARLFPQFGTADNLQWPKAIKCAQDGASDALSVIGWVGDVDQNPVCQSVRTFIGPSGKKGTEIRKHFLAAPFGWPQDAIDGALLALVAGGLVRASLNGIARSTRQIDQKQIGPMDFYSEGISISAAQRIAMRKLASDMGSRCKSGEEEEVVPILLKKTFDLAGEAGGPPPLPEKPSLANLDQLQALAGNEQFVAVYNAREGLLNEYNRWLTDKAKKEQRLPEWENLQHLAQHAKDMTSGVGILSQMAAIRADRTLLIEPDPVAPLVTQITDILRDALQKVYSSYKQSYDTGISQLEKMAAWQSIKVEDRKSILAECNLQGVPKIKVSSTEELLNTLDSFPIAIWESNLAALPTRIARANQQAVQLLEPKAVRVQVKSVTLKTPAEVDAYLKDLRAEIMKHISSGNPVII